MYMYGTIYATVHSAHAARVSDHMSISVVHRCVAASRRNNNQKKRAIPPTFFIQSPGIAGTAQKCSVQHAHRHCNAVVVKLLSLQRLCVHSLVTLE